MLDYILRRAFVAVLVMISISLFTFSLTQMAADPAVVLAGEGASTEDIEQARQAFGLDRPLPVQYAAWAADVLRGDFGTSFRMGQPVMDVIAARLPTTLILAACGMVLAVLVAIPLGVVAAMRPGGWTDKLSLLIAVVGQAMPSFWLGLILIRIFGVKLRLLPISGATTALHFVMPSIVLAVFVLPVIMRLTRSGMIEVLGSDYIRAARARGLGGNRVVFKHALRNAMVPVVALSAVQLGMLLGGSVIVETVFAMPGIGYLAWESISRADLPVIQAIVLIVSAIYVGLGVVSDLLNAFLNPRLRGAIGTS
ncbi:ABC transporter permease [Salipiger abyssi]|uniref:ABC transporter permease n=1 Tax=Salipiger abyssi TaxID=1250539 RepID=UPI001A8C5B9E|nr:ABC transporter permease [Salipiger abyssi]MBN9887190.1 ABC transporter permease [Salipiger abyssi]